MRVLIPIICVFLCFSCNDEIIIPPDSYDVSVNDVLVLNEGNFQHGNASLGIYNSTTNTYTSNVFKNSQGYPVGDVLQSVTTINGEYWLVINNSGKIIVLDSATLDFKHEIKGFTSPRYVTASYDQRKAFVSDLYSDELYVVNTSNYSISNHIPLTGWSDQMALVASHLWVTNREKPYVYIVDMVAEKVIDSIAVGNNASTLIQLDNIDVALLCEGKLNSGEASEIFFIDPKARQVAKSIAFDKGIKPIHLRQDKGTRAIYCAYKGIHAINPDTYTYEGKVLDLPDANIYGFDIDPQTGNLFIGDAKDFVEKSEVSIYFRTLDFKQKFTSGVICNGFTFR